MTIVGLFIPKYETAFIVLFRKQLISLKDAKRKRLPTGSFVRRSLCAGFGGQKREHLSRARFRLPYATARGNLAFSSCPLGLTVLLLRVDGLSAFAVSHLYE